MSSLRPDCGEFKRVSFDLSHIGRQPFQLDLDLRRFSHKVIFNESQRRQFHEIETTLLMSALLKAGDLVADIGAHIGYFSLLASRLVGDTGHVFSFEPIEENIGHLYHNMEINNARNITVVPKIVGDWVCRTPFHFNQDNDGGHALWDVGMHPANPKSKAKPIIRTLPMTTLDDQFTAMDVNRLKVIKIDTEGNEFNVLKGAENILKTYRIRCIVWELNTFGLAQMGHSEADLRQYMYELGYETLAFIDGRLKIIERDQQVHSPYIINQVFMPTEFVRRADP